MKKYGRTFHLPWSPGSTSDDKILKDVSFFENKRVIVTEKMDGENTTIHKYGTHARSIDGKYHPSRDWMKSFASTISFRLEDDERIIGEYLFAKHSIFYEDLPSYFLGFAFIKNDEFLSWDDTIKKFKEFNITSVPVLYDGIYDGKVLGSIQNKLMIDSSNHEGFVIRIADKYKETDMKNVMGKYVRENHIQTSSHWMYTQITQNGLQKE